MQIQEILARLCALPGPSGFEGPVAQYAMELLAPLMDEVYIHRMGSVVGVRRCGKPNARRLLLDAHLDEVGLIVTGEEDGYLRFRTLGGVDPRMLCDREVTVLTQPPLFGVVACLPPHVQSEKDMDKSTPISELYLDVGLCSERSNKEIPIGTPVVFRSSGTPLGTEQFCAKALDDRACMVSILRALELLKDETLELDLYVLFSTREETSSAGAITAVYDIAPDMCIAVDVTHGQTPDAPKDKVLKMGGGPAVGVGPNMTRWMSRRLEQLAKSKDIPCQLEVMAGHSGTNAWPMQISREGVATAVISLPLKYMHTPVEVIDLKDLELLSQLLAAFAADPGEEDSYAI